MSVGLAERLRSYADVRISLGPKPVIERMRNELGAGSYYALYRLAAALALSDHGRREPLPGARDSERQEVRIGLVDRGEDGNIFYRLFCRLEGRVLEAEEYRERLKDTIEQGLAFIYFDLGIGRDDYEEKDYRVIEKVLRQVGDSVFGRAEGPTVEADAIEVSIGHLSDVEQVVVVNDRSIVPAFNMAITGASGSGKTYFALRLLKQVLIGSRSSRATIIDPKGDITDKYGTTLEELGFRFYRLSVDSNLPKGFRRSLPINPFLMGASKNAVTERLLAVFREAVFQNNPVQQASFREAVHDVLAGEEPEGLTIERLRDAYGVVRGGRPDKVSNFLDSLVSNRVFAAPGKEPRGFFEDNVVVSYAPDLGADIQALVTNLLVTLFRDAHQHLSEGRAGSRFRNLHRIMFIDEAHTLSDMRSSGLKRLLREGRSFGLGLMLASQHVNHFADLVRGVDLREEVPIWFVLRQTLQTKDIRLLSSMFGASTPSDESRLNSLVNKLNSPSGGAFLAITNLGDLHRQGEPLSLQE